MSSPATDLSRERVEFLLHSPWPRTMDDVESWLRDAPKGHLTDPPPGSAITPVTVDTHDGQVSGFSWFATFSDVPRLIEAHDALAELISGLLGVPGIQERERDHSGYWVTSQFAIETYAHDTSDQEEGRQLKPTMQVSVADAALAASKEHLARGAL